jgi:hypothetical protein
LFTTIFANIDQRLQSNNCSASRTNRSPVFII